MAMENNLLQKDMKGPNGAFFFLLCTIHCLGADLLRQAGRMGRHFSPQGLLGKRLKAVCLRPFALHCIELPYILRSELRLDCAAHDEHEKDRIVPINGFEWQRVKIEPTRWQAHPIESRLNGL